MTGPPSFPTFFDSAKRPNENIAAGPITCAIWPRRLLRIAASSSLAEAPNGAGLKAGQPSRRISRRGIPGRSPPARAACRPGTRAGRQPADMKCPHRRPGGAAQQRRDKRPSHRDADRAHRALRAKGSQPIPKTAQRHIERKPRIWRHRFPWPGRLRPRLNETAAGCKF